MKKLLSLPPNLVGSFHEITELPKSEWFCTNDPVGKKLGSGGGTTWLLRAAYEANDEGRTFDEWLAADKRLLLVGGGVGVAPLLYFGAEIKKMGGRPSFLLGARTKTDLLQLELFEALGDVYVTTEDGSYGERGFVTNHSVLQTTHFDQISCCGPKPMMKAVAAYATKHDVSCEVSLENMMACGLGACLCCVEKTIEGNLCVCKDGPVLNIKKLLWQV